MRKEPKSGKPGRCRVQRLQVCSRRRAESKGRSPRDDTLTRALLQTSSGTMGFLNLRVEKAHGGTLRPAPQSAPRTEFTPATNEKRVRRSRTRGQEGWPGGWLSVSTRPRLRRRKNSGCSAHTAARRRWQAGHRTRGRRGTQGAFGRGWARSRRPPTVASALPVSLCPPLPGPFEAYNARGRSCQPIPGTLLG